MHFVFNRKYFFQNKSIFAITGNLVALLARPRNVQYKKCDRRSHTVILFFLKRRLFSRYEEIRCLPCLIKQRVQAAWWLLWTGCNGAGWEWCWRKCAPPTKSSQSFRKVFGTLTFASLSAGTRCPAVDLSHPPRPKRPWAQVSFSYQPLNSLSLCLRKRGLSCQSSQTSTLLNYKQRIFTLNRFRILDGWLNI